MYALETRNLSRKYGTKTAVDQVNIHIRPGTIYGLIGKNGAGKTSIMKMILGLIRKNSGEIFFYGKNMEQNRKQLLKRIGYLIEPSGFYPMLSARENLEIYAKIRGVSRRDAIEKALDAVGLSYQSPKKFSQFSLGMKQRLALGFAIMNDPEFIILDEPTNGLDPIGIAEIRHYIKMLGIDRKKTILLSSHHLAEVELIADDIGVLHEGKLLTEDSLQKIRKDSRKYIYVESDNSRLASVLLEQNGIRNYASIGEYGLKIYEEESDSYQINKLLMESGIQVREIYTKSFNLEEYFKEVLKEEVL